LEPKDAFRECENCPEMVVVPAGSFTMGSPPGEKDRDELGGVVTINEPFAVGDPIDLGAPIWPMDQEGLAGGWCGPIVPKWPQGLLRYSLVRFLGRGYLARKASQ